MQPAIQFDHVSKRFDLGSRRAYLKYLLPDALQDKIDSRNEKNRKDVLWALKDLSFDVNPGETLGLIGPNGAGKTTALSLLAGIISPTSGEIRVRGRIGALIKLGAGFHPDLSGKENVYLNGSILGLSRAEINLLYDQIVEFAELEDFMDTPVKRYSSGMYVRLGFSVAVHINPDILLVDEILSVGDISFQARCINRIGEIRDQGATIIFVSHNMHHIASFCDRVIYLNHGQIRSIGEPGEALALYNTDLMTRAINQPIETDDGSDISRINGTGKLIITDVKFYDKESNITDHIQTGSYLTARIYYQCQEPIENPLLDVVIRDASRGNMFQATNRDFGIELGNMGKSGHIDITFENITSNNQMLSFFFTMWSSNHTEIYDWKRNFKIQVSGNPLSSGRILFDCSWKKSINHPLPVQATY